MTRICEEFIEEITSGSGNVSAALAQHLASCSTCRETFASVKQLKDSRKPLSGKEAAAIAGMLKAVKAGTASTAVLSQTASGTGLLLKSLIVAVCVLSVIGALLMQAKSSDYRDEKPVNGITTVIKAPSTTAVTADVDENEDLTDNSDITDETQEDSKNGEAQTISVSPDEENIKLH